MLGGIAEVDTCGRVRIRKGREGRSTELVATWSPQSAKDKYKDKCKDNDKDKHLWSGTNPKSEERRSTLSGHFVRHSLNRLSHDGLIITLTGSWRGCITRGVLYFLK